MYKPSKKNLENEINELLDCVHTPLFTRQELNDQIISVLNKTYDTLNKLTECRIENEHLGKFENDRTSVQKYIDYYAKLLQKVEEQEDENLKFRYYYSKHIYETFLKNPEKALAELRVPIAGNIIFEFDEDTRTLISTLDSTNHDRARLNYLNKDLFTTLYNRLEGYQITHDKIIKSAGLKIFTFFDVITKVQKTKLATHIEYLFASLEEDLSLDPKRAGSVKIIGKFEGFILFDYMSNKKGELYDFGFEEVFGQILKAFVAMFKAQGNFTMVRRINNNRKRMEATLFARLLS